MDARGFGAVLRKLGDVPSRVAREAADALTARLAAGFASGMDPYGNAWAPLAPATIRKGRTPPPLTEGGSLAGGTRVVPLSGAGLGLESIETLSRGAPASIHMTGASGKNLPARPFLPTNALPATWRADLQAALSRIVKR